MGGLIIIAAILIPTLLLAKLDNVYVILLITATVWMGVIGFIDDYIKVFKKDKQGLAGRFKIVGQVGLGLIVGFALYFSDHVVVRKVDPTVQTAVVDGTPTRNFEDIKSTKTTVPFFKNNELDYKDILPFLGDNYTDRLCSGCNLHHHCSE